MVSTTSHTVAVWGLPAGPIPGYQLLLFVAGAPLENLAGMLPNLGVGMLAGLLPVAADDTSRERVLEYLLGLGSLGATGESVSEKDSVGDTVPLLVRADAGGLL